MPYPPYRHALSAYRRRARRIRPWSAAGAGALAQLEGQAEPPGRRGRALPVADADGAFHAGKADVMQRSAAGQAVLADQPDPAATGPGQLGGLIVGRSSWPSRTSRNSRVAPARSLTWCSISSKRAGRTGLRQLLRRGPARRAGLLGDLDDDAVGAARVQERLLMARVIQADPDGLDAQRPDPRQRVLDVVDGEVEVMRPGTMSGQEALQEGRVGAAGRRQQLDFRPRGEAQLAPPVAAGVTAVRPGPPSMPPNRSQPSVSVCAPMAK